MWERSCRITVIASWETERLIIMEILWSTSTQYSLLRLFEFEINVWSIGSCEKREFLGMGTTSHIHIWWNTSKHANGQHLMILDINTKNIVQFKQLDSDSNETKVLRNRKNRTAPVDYSNWIYSEVDWSIFQRIIKVLMINLIFTNFFNYNNNLQLWSNTMSNNINKPYRVHIGIVMMELLCKPSSNKTNEWEKITRTVCI